MFVDPEWTIYISRAKRLRKERIKRNHDASGMDIPLLLKEWSNAIDEIIKHLEYQELVRLSETSNYMRKYCEKEVKLRQEKIEYENRQSREFLYANGYGDDDYDYLWSEERNRGNCTCGGYKYNVTEYDPDCPGRESHNDVILDLEMMCDNELAVLLNPRLKDLIW